MGSFHFAADTWKRNQTRLTNQIFKLLPMYENNEDWDKQQHTIILELKGYNDMFDDEIGFMILVSKLHALSYAEDKMIFRKIVFEAISALQEVDV